MSVSVTCRACGARLKTPPGSTKPKPAARSATRGWTWPRARGHRVPPTGAKPAKPTRAKPRRKPPPTGARSTTTASAPLPVAEREEDPLPYLDLKPALNGSARQQPPLLPPAKAHDEPPLSLDDDPAPAPPVPEGPPPFRVPARVTADTADLFTGPCDAVLVPHGLFLESVPFRPFLYAPRGSPASLPGRRALAVSLPDGRTVTVEFLGRNATRVAEDTAAFLANERGVPDPRGTAAARRGCSSSR